MAAADAPVDLSQLRVITGGDPKAERHLAALYKQQSDKKLAALSESITDVSITEWQDAAHALKGGAASIGARTLARLDDEAQHFKDAATEDRKSAYARISAEYERVKSCLETHGLLM